jgi:hypothetical protein
MAHTVSTQVLLDNQRQAIIKITIKGDGASADLSKAVIYDASAYASAAISDSLMDITYCLNGFSGELFWGATADVAMMSLAKDHPHNECFFQEGGLVNNGGAGVTGDILLNTNGLAATANDGYIILRVKKRKYDIPI